MSSNDLNILCKREREREKERERAREIGPKCINVFYVKRLAEVTDLIIINDSNVCAQCSNHKTHIDDYKLCDQSR